LSAASTTALGSCQTEANTYPNPPLPAQPSSPSPDYHPTVASNSRSSSGQALQTLALANSQDYFTPAISATAVARFHEGDCGANRAETENQNVALDAWQPLLSLIGVIGSFPKVMLERALSPQKRWNANGSEYRIDQYSARVEPQLRDLFLEPGKMWLGIDHLISIAAIRVERTDDFEVYICASAPTEYSYDRERSHWVEQVFWLFCYIFPRNPIAL
jgi:hypothetical protein